MNLAQARQRWLPARPRGEVGPRCDHSGTPPHAGQRWSRICRSASRCGCLLSTA